MSEWFAKHFCLKTFTWIELNSWDEFVLFQKENYRWSLNNSTVNDWVGHIDDPTLLPSFHPYWTNEVKKIDLKELQRVEKLYEECKENPEMIKYHFNLSASIASIESRIQELKMKTENIVL